MAAGDRDAGRAGDGSRDGAGTGILAPATLTAVWFGHHRKGNQSILPRLIACGRVYLSNAAVGGHVAMCAFFRQSRGRRSRPTRVSLAP